MKRMLASAAVVATSILALTSQGVQAQERDCVISGNIGPIGANSQGTIELNSGETCKMFLTTSGTVESSRVSMKPKHGTLTLLGAGSASYKPAANYKGTDEFAVTIKGRSQANSGTSVLTVKATVR